MAVAGRQAVTTIPIGSWKVGRQHLAPLCPCPPTSDCPVASFRLPVQYQPMLRQLEHTTWLATSAGQQPGGSRFSRERWDWALSVSSVPCFAALSSAWHHSMQPVAACFLSLHAHAAWHKSTVSRLRRTVTNLASTPSLPCRSTHKCALQVVHSRTFGAPGPAGGVGVRMLVPLVDMLNHAGKWRP